MERLYKQELMQGGECMKKIVSSVLFLLFLMGCSSANSSNHTEQFIGEINAINNNVFRVDCSDEVNKTDDTWGYECPIEVTVETALEEQSGKKLNFENFSEGSVVEVTLTSSRDLMNDAKPFRADKVTKLSESE